MIKLSESLRCHGVSSFHLFFVLRGVIRGVWCFHWEFLSFVVLLENTRSPSRFSGKWQSIWKVTILLGGSILHWTMIMGGRVLCYKMGPFGRSENKWSEMGSPHKWPKITVFVELFHPEISAVIGPLRKKNWWRGPFCSALNLKERMETDGSNLLDGQSDSPYVHVSPFLWCIYIYTYRKYSSNRFGICISTVVTITIGKSCNGLLCIAGFSQPSFESLSSI